MSLSLCDSIDTLAMAYLDDELATEERHELETHLTECVACRAEVDAGRADQDLVMTSLSAPRASESMRMRLGRALDAADQAEVIDLKRAERRRLSQWMLPGVAILAAAAAILVFVVGLKPPGERVGSIAKAGLRQQTRALPLEVEGPNTGQWAKQFQQFAGAEAPQLESPGSRLVGGRFLPGGVSGHDGWLFAYDVPIKRDPYELTDRRVVLTMLKIESITPDEMSDGDEVKLGGRTLRVLQTDGHTAVTCVDANHFGYMFMAEELSVQELVNLVSKTSLVGPQ